ncbi:MAG: DUF4157 domain-containing protein [Dehalococcoidales bacterium]|nr:DUF4157 domain-containing protein [Dehalococcoidales bacterium]
MKSYEKANHRKQDSIEQKHNRIQVNPGQVSGPVHQSGQEAIQEKETPFQPPTKRHEALLLNSKSSNKRTNLMLQLQQTYGNTYVQRLLDSLKVQAELNISSPDDVYEREADQVAERVVQSVNREANIEEEDELQAKPISAILRKEETEEEPLAKPAAEIQPQEEDELEMKAGRTPYASVPENLEKRINDARGSGQNLPGDVREPMERAFGADFGDVRVHTDSEADSLNRRINARAFTRGQDVFFSRGEFNPASTDGRKLIAHELTHVIQQEAVPVRRQASSRKAKNNPQTDSYDAIHARPSLLKNEITRQPPEPERNRVEWGQTVNTGFESRWSVSSIPSGARISWAAETPGTIKPSREISWGASQESAGVKGGKTVPSAINSSIVTTIENLETTYRKGIRGVAPWPSGAVAPSFNYNIKEQKGEDGKSQFTAYPSITQNHSEGNSQPLHLGPGLQKTTSPESGVDVYENISAAMSKLDAAAENEHGNDYKYAAEISIGEAEDIIQNNLSTSNFGPKNTRAEAEQMVLDEFKSNLVHPQLGSDKTQWLTKYSDLQTKTLDRDNKGWHTFTTNNRQEVKDADGKVTKITYDLVQSTTTKIGQVPSRDVITY